MDKADSARAGRSEFQAIEDLVLELGYMSRDRWPGNAEGPCDLLFGIPDRQQRPNLELAAAEVVDVVVA